MLKTKKLFVLVFLLLNCILFSACSQSKEVDFLRMSRFATVILVAVKTRRTIWRPSEHTLSRQG